MAKILPLESADMTYDAITEGMRERMIIKDWQAKIGLDIAIKENRFSYRNGYVVPCWSLAVLLDVLNRSAYFVNEAGIAELSSIKATKWCVSILNCGKIENCYADNPVDACVAMIEKLKELNLL